MNPSLKNFLNNTEDKLEIRRCLAVEMLKAGIKSKKIEAALGFSKQSISKLKADFSLKGIVALKNGRVSKTKAPDVDLDEFIHKTDDSLERVRALSLKMLFSGQKAAEVAKETGYSEASILNLKAEFVKKGVEALKNHRRLLSSTQKSLLLSWLSTKQTCSVKELHAYMLKNFGVEYSSVSSTSYYSLLKEAGIKTK